LAVVPIYFGAFSSLKKWKNPEEKIRKIKRQIDDDDDEDQDAPSESFSADDTFKFPILGSLALFGLHYALREFDTAYVNYALTTYFSIMGHFATTQVGVNTLTAILGLLGIKVDSWRINLARPSNGKLYCYRVSLTMLFFSKAKFYTARFTLVHLVMLVASVMLAGYYAATKNWIASNIIAFSLALSAVQVFSLESFKAGIVLLGGLCISDAYWTYGSSEILQAVIKQVDIPIKVVFPRLLLGLPLSKANKFASIGLGEIVAPGLFVALCLRYDQHRAGQRNATLGCSTGFRKPYFIASLVAYVLGLGLHFYVSHTLKTTQPLIAYLSVACILSVFLTAAVRGESKQVFGYTSE
ncbi:MAG: peptidase A22B, signal peptide peptidase, partial [Linnemannia elongata]